MSVAVQLQEPGKLPWCQGRVHAIIGMVTFVSCFKPRVPRTHSSQ
jgi:hypothetical protein